MRLSFLTLFLTAGLISAGEGYDEKEQCMNEEGGVCSSCEFGEQETATLFAKFLAHELPDGATCNDYCAEGVAEAQEHPAWYFASALSRKPEGFKQLVPLVEERFASNKNDRARLLDLVSNTPGQKLELIHGLWEVDSKSFGVNHLLTFAEKGPEGMEARLRSFAGRSGEGAIGVAPAAYFALRGDDVGKKQLRKVVKSVKNSVPDSIAGPLLAAIALDKLGDKKALAFVRGRVHAAVLSALDNGDMTRARILTVQAKHLFDAARYPQLTELAYLEDILLKKASAAAKSDKLATAEAVFELIESVTPVS